MTLISITARRAALLTLASTAALLGACGGFTAVDVGGTITGLNSAGLVLSNGGSTVSPAPTDKTFVFPVQVAIRAPYDVTVATSPPRQQCKVFNGTGIAGAAPVTIVAVTCSSSAFTVGGTVNGLVGSSVVLTNGSEQVTVAAGTGTFTFPTKIIDQAAYGVAVLTQPTNGQICTVTNSSAFINDNVTNVTVTCI